MAKIRIENLERVRGASLETSLQKAREEAEGEFKKLLSNPLFLAGLGLFWSGGTRTLMNRIRYSSSDPAKVLVFLKFLSTVCGIEEGRIRVTLVVPPDVDPASAERFWSFASGAPLARFYKSAVLKTARTKRVGQGMCTVSVGGRYLREKMEEWMKMLPKALLER
jgi:hypothetical protein